MKEYTFQKNVSIHLKEGKKAKKNFLTNMAYHKYETIEPRQGRWRDKKFLRLECGNNFNVVEFTNIFKKFIPYAMPTPDSKGPVQPDSTRNISKKSNMLIRFTQKSDTLICHRSRFEIIYILRAVSLHL